MRLPYRSSGLVNNSFFFNFPPPLLFWSRFWQRKHSFVDQNAGALLVVYEALSY
jgi:hypothetical protein